MREVKRIESEVQLLVEGNDQRNFFEVLVEHVVSRRWAQAGLAALEPRIDAKLAALRSEVRWLRDPLISYTKQLP